MDEGYRSGKEEEMLGETSTLPLDSLDTPSTNRVGDRNNQNDPGGYVSLSENFLSRHTFKQDNEPPEEEINAMNQSSMAYDDVYDSGYESPPSETKEIRVYTSKISRKNSDEIDNASVESYDHVDIHCRMDELTKEVLRLERNNVRRRTQNQKMEEKMFQLSHASFQTHLWDTKIIRTVFTHWKHKIPEMKLASEFDREIKEHRRTLASLRAACASCEVLRGKFNSERKHRRKVEANLHEARKCIALLKADTEGLLSRFPHVEDGVEKRTMRSTVLDEADIFSEKRQRSRMSKPRNSHESPSAEVRSSSVLVPSSKLSTVPQSTRQGEGGEALITSKPKVSRRTTVGTTSPIQNIQILGTPPATLQDRRETTTSFSLPPSRGSRHGFLDDAPFSPQSRSNNSVHNNFVLQHHQQPPNTTLLRMPRYNLNVSPFRWGTPKRSQRSDGYEPIRLANLGAGLQTYQNPPQANQMGLPRFTAASPLTGGGMR